MYDDFASVYDMLMDDFDYDAWSAHYLTLIRTVTGELPRRAVGMRLWNEQPEPCAWRKAAWR